MNYNRPSTGINLDIFPVDKMYANPEAEDVKRDLYDRAHRYQKYIYSHMKERDTQEFDDKRDSLFNQNINVKGDGYFFHCAGFAAMLRITTICKEDIIFPLDTLSFEGYELKVPHDTDTYLTDIYGDYMSFPHEGTEKHGVDEGCKILELAEKNGVNMDEILEKLKDIERFFRSQI